MNPAGETPDPSAPLSPRRLRQLRLHQEEFIKGLAARLSLRLRLEFSLKLTGLQTIAFQALAESWVNPSHLTLFKLEPLRGVSILEIPPRLASSLVNRLMGGSGQTPEPVSELSEIEQALLEQTAQLFLDEWCRHWSKVKELKPAILGCESNGRFLQTAPPETVMLVLSLAARLGECLGQIQIAFPCAALDVLVRHLGPGFESVPNPAPKPAAPALCQWNTCFDEVCVPFIAEWNGLEMTAREVLALKVGDVIQMDPRIAQQVNVRLADLPKFQGRPGAIAGQWAVELTQAIRR